MLKIKEWETYQSYKDRSPPWIRLHKKILNNYQFQKMSAEARALLPMLWLLAAEDEDPKSGMVGIDIEEMSFRLHRDQLIIKTSIDEIVRAGFVIRIEDGEPDLFSEKTDSYIGVTKPLRNCHPESEAETESDTETEVQKEDAGDGRDTIFKLGEKIAEIVGWKDDPRWMGNYSRLESWLAGGCDFEKDILPTIKYVMSKKIGDRPKSLNYFESAVADAYATRTTPMKKGNPNAKPDRYKNKSERAREAAMRGLKLDVGK